MGTDADLVLDAPPDVGAFGSVCGLEDIDGDGRDDIAISAEDTNTSSGAVYVMLGDPMPATSSGLADAADVTWTGVEAYQGLGASIGSPGELTGDGYRDIASSTSRTGSLGAHLYVLAGAAALRGTYTTDDAWADVSGGNAEAQGKAIADAADVNGDGRHDLYIGAWDTAAVAGQAWLFYGSAP